MEVVMSGTSVFICGILVFGIAISSSLLTVLGGAVTPAEQTESSKKISIIDNGVGVTGNS